MSTQFYCNFSGEQARQHGIPRGVIEIHADSLNEAREIATKWFPATADLPFGGWGEIYTITTLPVLGVATTTHRTWTFIGKEIA